MSSKKLAIITTHPIQYNAPFYRELAQRGKIEVKVFYTLPQALEQFHDKDFDQIVSWDIPLLEGYEYVAVDNVSSNPNSKGWSGIDCPSLNNRIKNWGADAVLVYGWNLKSHFFAMRHFKGIVPVLFRGDSHLIDDIKGLKTLLRTLVLKIIYRYVDIALYVGRHNRAYFLKHGLKQNQLKFAPHAIDNDRFFDSDDKGYEKSALEWRIKLGYKENDIVILFCGKFEAKKNPKLLLQAFCGLNLPDTHLLFIGNGNLEPELRQLAEGNSKIQFLPFQNQSKMPIVYRLANIFCLPSSGPRETWGLAANEAMACSRTVLLSNKVGCAIDLIDEGKNGYVFISNSIDDLQMRLKKMVCEDFLDDMGKHSANIIKKWNYQKVCEVIEGTINA